jgi:plasmid stabilization system protein ParE
MSQAFELHPGAANDITEIWEFIAKDNPAAATASVRNSWARSASLRLFQIKATGASISVRKRSGFKPSAII